MTNLDQLKELADRKVLTQEILKVLLHYDPQTGTFTWLERYPPYIKPCYVAGWKDQTAGQEAKP